MKNYVIIGASSGIGAELAQILVKQGHQVFGTYHKNEPTGPDTPNLHMHALDVMQDTLDLSFAPEQVDGVVYCPGSISLKPFARIAPEAFVADYHLQVIGAVKVLQALIPNLKKAEQSSILLFSTVAVQSGFTFHTQVASSKGAIEGLARALAAEYAPRIRVNCIAPSITDTPLAASLLSTPEKREASAQRHPLKKIGTPKDIAQMANFLLSDDAAWITGQIMHVDGGMSHLKV